jgi:hypothetical protein
LTTDCSQADAVEELSVAIAIDHEPVEIAGRIRDVAQEPAVRAEHLQPGVGILHADVDLAGRADGDVAVHVADLVAARRKRRPTGRGMEGQRRVGCHRGGGDRGQGEQDECAHGSNTGLQARLTRSRTPAKTEWTRR